MIRFTFTLLTLAILSPSGFCGEIFAHQLRGVQHVGLSVDEGLAAFTVYAYTRTQYNEHVKSLKAFRRDSEAYNERMAGYRRERQEAQKRHASSVETNAITTKESREIRPYSPFDKRIKLNTVVGFGDDFIAIAPLDKPSQKILIPFDRIGRVIITRSSDASSTADGAK